MIKGDLPLTTKELLSKKYPTFDVVIVHFLILQYVFLCSLPAQPLPQWWNL